jgi:energy-coupling factor transporter ATP-binding protein EcfA2
MFLFKNKIDVIESTLNTENIDREKCRSVYTDSIFTEQKADIAIQNHVYDNLEIYKDYTDNADNSIFNIINKTQTISGEIYLKRQLNMPTTNVNTLRKLRRDVERIMDNYELIDTKLREIQKLERNLIPYCHNFEEQENIINSTMINFKLLNFLNNSENFLNLYNNYNIFSPIYNLLSPILVILIPFFLAKLYFLKDIDISKYFGYIFIGVPALSMPADKSFVSMAKVTFTILMYLYTLYTSTTFSFSTQRVLNTLHQRLVNLKQYIHIFGEIQELIGNKNSRIHYSLLDDKAYDNPYHIVSNKGKLIRHYKIINADNGQIRTSLAILGEVDFLYSIATLVRNHGYNFSEYIENKKNPCIFMKNFFHPSIPNAVKNTIDIGLKTNRNIVLTGPNAGGKSTLIKTLSIAVLLAQTIGIAPVEKMYITPFHYVNTYLNIYDTKGKKSLFENEMERISNHIKRIKSLKPNEFAFIIIDELFSGTNPKEGVASSFAIGEQLATYPNSITVVTTHYPQLTKLTQFTNYKMEINRNNGKLNFTYQLKPGISNDYIAVDLLKDNNFDQSIVDKANEIKEAEK